MITTFKRPTLKPKRAIEIASCANFYCLNEFVRVTFQLLENLTPSLQVMMQRLLRSGLLRSGRNSPVDYEPCKLHQHRRRRPRNYTTTRARSQSRVFVYN